MLALEGHGCFKIRWSNTNWIIFAYPTFFQRHAYFGIEQGANNVVDSFGVGGIDLPALNDEEIDMHTRKIIRRKRATLNRKKVMG